MTKPFRHQREDAAALERWGGRGLLAQPPGSGKSLTSLLYAKRSPGARPVVVVCPAGLKWNWQREAARHFGWQAEVLEGTRPGPRSELYRPQVVVVNYEILGPWLPYLKALSPQVLVLDECHYLANRSSQRTRNVKKLAAGVPHVLGLSGTPLTNRPAELWPVLNLLRPDLFPSFGEFAQRYCDPRLRQWGWDFRGATNLEELHRLLTDRRAGLMIRRTKEELLPDLPAKTRTAVPLDLPGPALKEYRRAAEDFVRWLAKRSGAAKARRAARAEAVTKVGYLKRLAAEGKLPGVLRWCDDWLEEDGGKLIVFAVHKVIVSGLRKHFGAACVVVDGSASDRERRTAVDQFQGNKRTRVFVGNIRAAGVGLTLTAASTVAFAELGWTPGEHLQAEDRAHRIGQKDNVAAYYLVARSTVEEKLCKLLQGKKGVLDATLDGEDATDGLDLFDQLVAELKRGEP